jgi:hypothetical protein
MDAATPSRVAGLDWASRLHAVCVLDPDGRVRARFDVPHTGRELAGLIRPAWSNSAWARSRSSDPTARSWRPCWPLGWRSW